MATLAGSVQNTNRLSLQQEIHLRRLTREGPTLELQCETQGYGLTLKMGRTEAQQLHAALQALLAHPHVHTWVFDRSLTTAQPID
jgi:hypothetical protein